MRNLQGFIEEGDEIWRDIVWGHGFKGWTPEYVLLILRQILDGS